MTSQNFISCTKTGASKTESGRNQVNFFRKNGFLVIEDALSDSEVSQLRQEAIQICRGDRGQVADLPSFLPEESSDEILQRTLCVHFPYKISQIMFEVLAHPVIVDNMMKLIGPNVKCMQQMLFIKSAGKPGQAWHQDESFVPTRDRSLNAAWIALDNATIENCWICTITNQPHEEWSSVSKAGFFNSLEWKQIPMLYNQIENKNNDY